MESDLIETGIHMKLFKLRIAIQTAQRQKATVPEEKSLI